MPSQTYGRAVWDSTWADAKPGFMSKLRTPIEALLSAGLVLAAYRLNKMEIAADFAAKTAIGIVAGLAAFAVLHLGLSWATAPRRIFYAMQEELAALVQQKLTRDKLRVLITLLQSMIGLKDRLATTDQELEEWCRERDSLIEFVQGRIATISEIDAGNFGIVSYIQPMSHVGTISQHQSDQITKLLVYIERLQQLIDRYSAALAP
jgi:hypothetical protein